MKPLPHSSSKIYTFVRFMCASVLDNAYAYFNFIFTPAAGMVAETVPIQKL